MDWLDGKQQKLDQSKQKKKKSELFARLFYIKIQSALLRRPYRQDAASGKPWAIVWQPSGLPLSPFFCFSLSLYFMLSANQLSLPTVAAQITAACQQYPGTHSISSHLEALSLRPNYKCKVREPEICLDGDHLIQSARGGRAHKNSHACGEPTLAHGWVRETETQRCPQRREARQLAQAHAVLTPESESRGRL